MPALLLVSYTGILGGAERVLLDCAAGVPGDHVVACPAGELAGRARGAGLGVLELPERSLDLRAGGRARVRAIAALVAHARELRRLGLDLDPDLIVAWGMRSAIAGLLGGLGGARRARADASGAALTRFAVCHHDFLPGPLIGAAVRAAAARAAAVVVPSRAVAEDLDPGGALGGRLRIVHPGVDLERFAGTGGPAEPPEVLVLGSLVAWKRPELALEIFARARRRHPELRLRLVGEPVTGAEEVLAGLRERLGRPDLVGAVQLAGASPDPVSELERATCLLHCAPREPFGLVILEAMASARPVIAPDAAGPREILDGSCAWLYPPGDAEAGAAALVELASAPERARAAGLAGRHRARRRFSRDRVRAGFAAALEDVIPDRAGSPPETRLEPDRLTVVTVTHNSEDDLSALLDSVAGHLPGTSVVVVDCASRDGTVAEAERRPGVRVVALEANLGFGRACNRGLGLVATPATALLNPDVELIDGSLLELAAAAVAPGGADRLLVPRVLDRDGSRQDTVHPLPVTMADLTRSFVPPAAVPGRAGVMLAPWRADAPRRVGWAVGCALVASSELLLRLGPFDESIFMYGEDLDLGLRADQEGIQTWLVPSVRVVHHRAHSSQAAFGGEPFAVLARARHDVVRRRLGARRAALDDLAQQVTFASRWALKRTLGRPAARERRQLDAIRSIRRPGTLSHARP